MMLKEPPTHEYRTQAAGDRLGSITLNGKGWGRSWIVRRFLGKNLDIELL